jgi:RNase P/RNase MRP subunit p29
VNDTNPYNINVSGSVVDETRNTLILMKDSVQKIIIKNNALFHFSLPLNDVQVEGVNLLGRSEDRVKKTIKRRW